jgi:type IV pilus assembly protein PilE
MVTVVIAAILFAIAIPSYTYEVQKSRRTEAKTALLDLAGREERFYSTNSTYTNSLIALGYAAVGSGVTNSLPSIGSGYYSVAVATTAAAPPALATFTITATAIGTQAKDTACATFTVNQAGTQGATSANCW